MCPPALWTIMPALTTGLCATSAVTSRQDESLARFYSGKVSSCQYTKITSAVKHECIVEGLSSLDNTGRQ